MRLQLPCMNPHLCTSVSRSVAIAAAFVLATSQGSLAGNASGVAASSPSGKPKPAGRTKRGPQTGPVPAESLRWDALDPKAVERASQREQKLLPFPPEKRQ